MWIPEVGKPARVADTAKGLYERLRGLVVEVTALDLARSVAGITVNRQPYEIPMLDLIEPKPNEAVVAGGLPELLTRITRLADTLKTDMRAVAVVGFGDGARWRADIVDGKLKIWEV